MSKKCYEECDGICKRCPWTSRCDVFQENPDLCMEPWPKDTITEEDIWYAMTDGMYGDYPGGDIDYSKYGF